MCIYIYIYIHMYYTINIYSSAVRPSCGTAPFCCARAAPRQASKTRGSTGGSHTSAPTGQPFTPSCCILTSISLSLSSYIYIYMYYAYTYIHTHTVMCCICAHCMTREGPAQALADRDAGNIIIPLTYRTYSNMLLYELMLNKYKPSIIIIRLAATTIVIIIITTITIIISFAAEEPAPPGGPRRPAGAALER